MQRGCARGFLRPSDGHPGWCHAPTPHLQELLKLSQLAPDAGVLLGHFLTEALLKHALSQGLGQLRVKPVQVEHGSWHPGVGGAPGAEQGWDWREGNIGEEGGAGSELMRLLDVFNHVETVLYLDSSIILRASLGKTDRTLKNEVSK